MRPLHTTTKQTNKPIAMMTLQGFQHLKLVRGARTTAFVEFVDVATGAAAHAAHQNTTVPSSDRGPLRVQFSKNPYGKKRDVSAHARVCL